MSFIQQLLNEMCHRHGWPDITADAQGEFHFTLDEQTVSIVRNMGQYRLNVACLQLSGDEHTKSNELDRLLRFLTLAKTPVCYGTHYNEQFSMLSLYCDIPESGMPLNAFETLVESLVNLGEQLKQHCQPHPLPHQQTVGSHFIRL